MAFSECEFIINHYNSAALQGHCDKGSIKPSIFVYLMDTFDHNCHQCNWDLKNRLKMLKDSVSFP